MRNGEGKWELAESFMVPSRWRNRAGYVEAWCDVLDAGGEPKKFPISSAGVL